MDVFFYEAFAEEVDALKRYLPMGINAAFTSDTIQENPLHDPPAPLISIRTQSVIPRKWGRAIKGILTRSTGFDHVHRYLAESASPLLPAGYLPLYCSRSVAEQAMLLWMSLIRKLPKQMHNFSTFNRDGLTGNQCAGKVLLVVGVGNIGYEVCCIGEGLGMEVLGVDIIQKHGSVRYVNMEDAMTRADIIVCAMNLTGKNRGFFNYGVLKKTKPGTIFVNIARGELSPSPDLLQLLKEGHLAGVGLDVYDKESSLAGCLRCGGHLKDSGHGDVSELMMREDVVLTPHNAFNTKEAIEEKARQSVAQVKHFLEKGSFIWPVPEIPADYSLP